MEKWKFSGRCYCGNVVELCAEQDQSLSTSQPTSAITQQQPQQQPPPPTHNTGVSGEGGQKELEAHIRKLTQQLQEERCRHDAVEKTLKVQLDELSVQLEEMCSSQAKLTKIKKKLENEVEDLMCALEEAQRKRVV